MASASTSLLRPSSHETLMASMMARSTPRVIFRSQLVRHFITALELLAAVNAVVMFITLCALHVRFVRNDGCVAVLTGARLAALGAAQHAPPVIQFDIASPPSASSAQSPRCDVLRAFPSASSFRFSRERGFLLLSDASLAHFNISVRRITVSAHHECLGDPVLRFLLGHLVGYETIAVNAFARMRRHTHDANGYVLVAHNKRLFNLMHADPIVSIHDLPLLYRILVRVVWKAGAIMTACFIMCTTAALVHFFLKEVQLRMINLTIDLQVVMRSQQSYGRVLVQYAVDALVFVPIIAGMLFFLFEFFDDQALAFSVLVIAWLCAFAASGSTRHWVSRVYLPRLFFCYFGAFHVYFFSFPLGFSWLAFATSIAFMVHAALTVWNHCELPVLRRQRSFHSPD
ncbi:unnamed protein product [Agarophyton chilense]